MCLATKTGSWANLIAHHDEVATATLQDLFDVEQNRAQSWMFSCGDLLLDLSKTHITRKLLDLLVSLAKEQNVELRRQEMVTGAIVNVTERRPVLHTALRAQRDEPVGVNGENVIPSIRAEQAKMKKLVEDVYSGTWRGATGKKITDVISFGIGGSDLGPRLVVEALREHQQNVSVHFVANMDAAEWRQVMCRCDPATTLCVMVTKGFATEETIENVKEARQWIIEALGYDSVKHHFVAVTSNAEAATTFGIDEGNIFAMWDWVGGRYSLWSSVGLGIAFSIGYDGFEKLLAGAAKMDEHFKNAPLSQNIPVLMALTGIWYHNFCHMPALAVMPYSERLRDLPRFLQQLDMESNGKRVTCEGELVDYSTGPIVFGECGTISQHSFHQWLHQGPQTVLSHFIGTREDDLGHKDAHTRLNEHRMAQMEALAFGRQDDDPARANPGNKPVMDLTIARHDPENMGLLLAAFEHKVAVQGFVWGLNSFDQFGVQLGKTLVSEARKKKELLSS